MVTDSAIFFMFLFAFLKIRHRILQPVDANKENPSTFHPFNLDHLLIFKKPGNFADLWDLIMYQIQTNFVFSKKQSADYNQQIVLLGAI